MKAWHAEGLGVKTIARRLERSTDTVSKHVFKKNERGKKKPVGRPQTISDERFAAIMSTYEAMLAKAKNSAEVTAAADAVEVQPQNVAPRLLGSRRLPAAHVRETHPHRRRQEGPGRIREQVQEAHG